LRFGLHKRRDLGTEVAPVVSRGKAPVEVRRRRPIFLQNALIITYLIVKL